MQINTTSQSVAAQVASSTTNQTQQTAQAEQPQTLQDDTVSISAAAQDMQTQDVQAFSGSGGGTWPTVKPK